MHLMTLVSTLLFLPRGFIEQVKHAENATKKETAILVEKETTKKQTTTRRQSSLIAEYKAKGYMNSFVSLISLISCAYNIYLTYYK